MNLSWWLFSVVNFCEFSIFSSVKKAIGGFTKVFTGGEGAAGLGGFLGNALGGPIGGALGSAAAGALFGPSQGSIDRQNRKDFNRSIDAQKELVTLGNQQDIANQKEMYDYRINQGIDAGMTPYEMYMGPAAGAGGGTTASGQTLGNAASAQQASIRESALKMQENDKNRMTQLAQTAMQAGAQRDVAQINAGVQTRGQDITAETAQAERKLRDKIEGGKLQLGRDQLNANLQRIAVQNAVDLKQVEKLVNDIATSHPDFVLRLKQMSMGVENMLVEYFQRHHGINLYDEKSFMSLPFEKREALISEMIAISSPVYGAAAAVKDQGGQTVDDLITTLGNAPGALWDLYKEEYGNAKEGLGNYFGGFRRKKPPPKYENYSRDFPGH